MTNFTKGPWAVSGSYIKCEKGHIAQSKAIFLNSKDLIANAHLIAAAPDMYAMIKEVADMQKQWYGYGMDTHMKLAKMAKKMELILSKSRGE
tara:strand:+ start:73 stop:348 length:276 start_codon:yes stop_codon:yes gene_type:complete